MADSRSGAGNSQDELGTIPVIREASKTTRPLGLCTQKDSGAILKRIPLAKDGAI